MKTTLDLPEDLIAEAMKITGGNKTQTIIVALEGLIRKDKIAENTGEGSPWTKSTWMISGTAVPPEELPKKSWVKTRTKKSRKTKKTD